MSYSMVIDCFLFFNKYSDKPIFLNGVKGKFCGLFNFLILKTVKPNVMKIFYNHKKLLLSQNPSTIYLKNKKKRENNRKVIFLLMIVRSLQSSRNCRNAPHTNSFQNLQQ